MDLCPHVVGCDWPWISYFDQGPRAGCEFATVPKAEAEAHTGLSPFLLLYLFSHYCGTTVQRCSTYLPGEDGTQAAKSERYHAHVPWVLAVPSPRPAAKFQGCSRHA